MNEFPSTVRVIPPLVAVTIGLFASGAVAQNYLQREPGEAPGVSQDGPGKPDAALERNTAYFPLVLVFIPRTAASAECSGSYL
jgi:hypothetical protein